jgi:hypothetical protein
LWLFEMRDQIFRFRQSSSTSVFSFCSE